MVKSVYKLLVLGILIFLSSNIAFALPVKKMNNVSDAMLDAQFWIEKLSDANDVLMSGEEIAAFNKDIENKLSDVVYDLASFKETFSKSDLLKYVDEKFPSEPCYVNGKLLDKGYWDKLRAQMNMQGISERNNVRYGIVVRRTNLKIFPTSDIVSDDPKDICYDQFQNSGVLVNEPVLVLHQSLDAKWLYIFMYNCSGWVLAQDIGMCLDKETWLKNQSFKDFLVVSGNKIRLEPEPYAPETSELELSMGTVLQLADASELPKSINERALYDNYVVKIPVRGEHGKLIYELALLPVSRDVRYGFLPYTRANVLKQAFKMHGDRYGWGGMLNSRDCSEFVLEVYRCFGFKFPRNSASQGKIPCKTADFTELSIEEKGKLLDKLAPGATLHFPGHVMIYVGKDAGRYYIISDLGSFAEFEPGAIKGNVIRTRSVVVNDLSIKRANGMQWIEALTKAKQYEKTSFKDLQGYKGREIVESLADRFIVSEYAKALFKPTEKITRGEFAATIAKALRLGEDREYAREKFQDLKDTWFEGYVGVMAKGGYINGIENNLFNPNAYLTKQEMSAILSRVIEKKKMLDDKSDAGRKLLGEITTVEECAGNSNYVSQYEAAMVVYNLLGVVGK